MNKDKRIRLFSLATVVLMSAMIGVPFVHGARKLPVVRIGIVRDGPQARFGEHVSWMQREILTLTTGEFDVRFPDDKDIHGNWNAAEIKGAVGRLLADPQVDLLITVGYLGSNYVCHRPKLPKPVIAAVVADAKLQNLPLKDGASGVKNLTYIDSFISFERDIKVFRDIVPFHHLAILVSDQSLKAIPWLRQKFGRLAYEYTIDVSIVGVKGSAEEALAALPPETDAVYVTPNPHLPVAEFGKLVSGLIERKLPSFSMFGRDDVEAGILASSAPKSNITRLLRRIALNVQRILLGEEAGTLPVAFPVGEQITINMATARAIGVYPPWGVLTEADLLHEKVEGIARRYSLESAVRQAIAANLDLLAEDRNVAAGEQVVKEARSVLLPQIELRADAVVIDEDRASSSLGREPERSASGAAIGSQLIYSEDAWSNYTVEKNLQTSREEQRETVRLDIARDAAVAYLNVLRTKTLEGIQKENLKLTRANLERARVRVSIGVANRAEEFRWESEIATARQDVLEARARREQTETNLNRLLNRPLEEDFLTEETSLNDPLLLISDNRFFFYVDNPRNFNLFKDFLVEEGLEIAPELKQLDAAIAAQERILATSKRAFWLPTFSIDAFVSNIFAKEGEGTTAPSIGPISIPQKDDTDWSVGVFATFPLIEGGGKFATIKRAREDLSRLSLDRESTAEKVEERIRVAVDETGFSYPSIRLSREGSQAASRNLDLVTEQYVRGVVSIIDLLDAQNNALVAAEKAENAVYTFLIDLMDVQRAMGRFDFYLSAKEREAWFQRLETFFRKAGVSPRWR